VAHGLIVQDSKTEYYLITAAHVVVPFVRSETAVICVGKSSELVKITLGDMFISSTYVAKGSPDVAAIKFTIKDSMTPPFEKEDGSLLQLQTADSLHNEVIVDKMGKRLFGHTQSAIISGFLSSRLSGAGHCLVNGTSVPGCSGAPLVFGDSVMLLVHGVSLHRGHSSTSMDSPLGAYYADTIPTSLVKLKRNRTVAGVLDWLECDIEEYKKPLDDNEKRDGVTWLAVLMGVEESEVDTQWATREDYAGVVAGLCVEAGETLELSKCHIVTSKPAKEDGGTSSSMSK